MADISNLSNYLKDVADAIREKKGTEDQIPAANFDTEILSIETGVDVSGVTANASDVKVNKKFIDNTGELKSGTFPDISYNSTSSMNSYEVVTTNLTVSSRTGFYRAQYLTKEFKGLIYEVVNQKIVIRNSIKTLQSIELSEVPWVLSVGCKDVYNENTVLIALTYNDRVDFYFYNYINNDINLSGTITASDYDIPADSEGRYVPVCFLSPTLDLISISWGFYDTVNSSYCWICRLKPNFTFEKLQQVYGSVSIRGSYFSSVYWLSNDIICKSYGHFVTSSTDGVYLNLIIDTSAKAKQFLYNNGTLITSVDSTIIAIDENQEYCIVNPSGNRTEYLLKKLNISASDVIIGDTIEVFTVANKVFTFPAAINSDLIVIADYPNYKYASKFYTLDRNTDTVTEINELIPNCEVLVLVDETLYVGRETDKGFYILTTTVDNITSMEYEGKIYLDTSDTNATANDIASGKTAYVNGEKISGTMPNNGELNYNSSTEEQTIPAGYTSGGTIAPAPLTDTEYDECLKLSEQILGENVSL